MNLDLLMLLVVLILACCLGGLFQLTENFLSQQGGNGEGNENGEGNNEDNQIPKQNQQIVELLQNYYQLDENLKKTVRQGIRDNIESFYACQLADDQACLGTFEALKNPLSAQGRQALDDLLKMRSQQETELTDEQIEQILATLSPEMN